MIHFKWLFKYIFMKRLFPLLFFVLAGTTVFAGNVDTIRFYSKVLKKETSFVIITPTNYEQKNMRLPVVYLLHGHGGNYASFIHYAAQLPAKADQLNILMVCPDGGFNSWYFDSPVDSSVRYETMITTELINYIDQHYPTVPDRKHRGITGLSMGGHGALYLAIRHSETFGAAGSLSGGVDIRPFPKNWQISKVLGDIDTNRENWEKNTVINVADQLKNGMLKISFECGTGDFFLTVNRALHQKLLTMKIDHDYAERPGEHNKAYWENGIDYQLLFFKKYFDNM